MPKKNVTPEQLIEVEEQIVNKSKRIDFFTTEYNIELLVNKLEQKDFEIPEYQREFTWGIERQSKFIESVHMGLPIPFIFLWETSEGKMEIIDGSQRLRTLHSYVKKGLILKGLDEIESLVGTKFDDLTDSRKRKFLNKSIRGIVLHKETDEQARFDMFERINTSSKTANFAEIRRGALPGLFQTLIQNLAENTKFIKLAPSSEASKKERLYEELLARFFAYGDDIDIYKNSPNKFIFDYTQKMNKDFEDNPDLSNEYRDRFIRMLDFVEKHFPNGFMKAKGKKSTPRVRFEAIAIGVDKAISENPELMKLQQVNVAEWVDGDDFIDVTTSDAANVKSKLLARINFVKDKLLD